MGPHGEACKLSAPPSISVHIADVKRNDLLCIHYHEKKLRAERSTLPLASCKDWVFRAAQRCSRDAQSETCASSKCAKSWFWRIFGVHQLPGCIIELETSIHAPHQQILISRSLRDALSRRQESAALWFLLGDHSCLNFASGCDWSVTEAVQLLQP